MFGHHLYIWMPHMCSIGPPYVWTPPICMDTPLGLDALICLDAPICVAPLATLFSLLQLFGCPPVCFDTPHMFGHHLYIWMPHMCSIGPPYIWTPPICMVTPLGLDALICLDAPCMFGCPHMCSTTGNTFQPAATVWMSPCMFGYTPCLDTPICLDASICVALGPIYLDTIHMYGYPFMFGCHHMFSSTGNTILPAAIVWMPPMF